MDTLYLIIISIIALISGLVAGYFAGLMKGRSGGTSHEAEREAEKLRAELLSEQRQVESLGQMLNSQREELTLIRADKENEARQASRLGAEKEGLENQLATQKQQLAELQELMRKDFEILANKILNEKSETFNKISRTSIDQVLEPLRVKIKEFETKVDETHKDNIRETTSLREEIKGLKETSQRMSLDAENLVKALKNDTKTQGNWGEMVLERILESSGLVKGREYFLQQSFTQGDGSRLQPDVMLQLPDNKFIIIDSKVSLVHYERYSSEENEDARKLLLRQHIQSMKTHFKGLAEKKYDELANGQNLDFILMFVPIEPAYITALNAEPGLFNEAFQRGILIVSPTMLLASLRIINSSWKHEYQNRNAQEIASRGRVLYEKFVSFTDDMKKIGDQLDRTQSTYGDAMKKLSEGKGNLVRQAAMLSELGVNAKKQIDGRLITETDDSE
jgi:DNA recombination protein RmuC